MNVTSPSKTQTKDLVVRPRVEVFPDSALVTKSPTQQTPIDVADTKPRSKCNTDGPGQVGPVGPVVTEPASPAGAIEKEVLVVLSGGFEAVAAKVVELKDMLMRSRMVQEAKDRLDVEVDVLEALAGGKPGLNAKGNEIRQLMMVALLDERGSQKLELELDVLARVAKDFTPLEKRMDAIDSLVMRALLTPDASASLAAECRALKAFVHGGGQIASEIAITEQQLSVGVAPAMKDTLTLELSALLGVSGGLTGVRERLQAVNHSITPERNTLEALEKALSTFERRADQIG